MVLAVYTILCRRSWRPPRYDMPHVNAFSPYEHQTPLPGLIIAPEIEYRRCSDCNHPYGFDPRHTNPGRCRDCHRAHKSSTQPQSIEYRRCSDCHIIYGSNPNRINPGRCSQCDKSHRNIGARHGVIRIRPRDGRPCTVCRLVFSRSHFGSIAPNENVPPGRCKGCQRKQRCTRCDLPQPNANFKKPRGAPGLYVTCESCRAKDASAQNKRRELALATGMLVQPIPSDRSIDWGSFRPSFLCRRTAQCRTGAAD